MEEYSLLPNIDGTYTLLVFVKTFNYEFGTDFFDKKIGKKIIIKTVKLIFAGGLVISVPASVIAKKPDTFNMSYVYFGSVAQQIENIKKSEKVINTVSPSYFDLNTDGSLKLTGISKDFISQMHSMNIRVVPFLSNHWNKEVGSNALDNRESLADEIAKAVYKYNLDGINVDIENVNHTFRDKYTDLVKLLRKKLPDKEVSVAVAANPYGWSSGWHGSYDYEELAKYSDYLMIMSYDEHYEGGEPGPVASIDFVKDSIEYALELVPEEKIVVGIPFYGRLWGKNHQGTGIALNRVNELIDKTGAKVIFDAESKSVCANIKITNQSFTLNGKKLAPGNYTLWFENEDSIRAKYKLIEEYNIKGAGHWSAGQENDGIWDYYELWVKGIYFNDIIGHFAKDSIIKLNAEEIMIGKTEDDFKPMDSLTRAEAAVIISRVLDISPVTGKYYSDTKGHWAEKYINSLCKKGIISGYSDGTFKPDKIMSRQEMAMLLSRVVELDYHKTKPYFKDVPESLWSFEEISALTAAGIMKGYEDGTFKPYNPVTRGETAALIDRIINANF